MSTVTQFRLNRTLCDYPFYIKPGTYLPTIQALSANMALVTKYSQASNLYLVFSLQYMAYSACHSVCAVSINRYCITLVYQQFLITPYLPNAIQ